MKQIPNAFTLLNLFFGCLAIVFAMQNELTPILNENGSAQLNDYGRQIVELPEKITWASIFICIAAVVDFLDGFVARLFKATSEMGKQLDSLADVVSFGVAPSIIVYHFLRVSYASQENGLEVQMVWLMPAFLIACAGAYRLARFNIDTQKRSGFMGVPIPAAGLLIASFPLIYWSHNTAPWIIDLLRNPWFWYALIILISYLMVSKLSMISLKMKDLSFKNNTLRYVLVAAALVCLVALKWLAVPVIFIIYVILSRFSKEEQVVTQTTPRETPDITV